MAFVTSGLAGAKTSGPETTQTQKLGTLANGDNGAVWMYVQASTSITQYYAVGIDEDYKANALSSTAAAAGHAVGWAQSTIDASEYFWAQMQGRGNINIAVASSCAADVALYTTTTAGVLDDSATATQYLIEGVVIVGTQASTTGLAGTEAIVTYPRNK